MGNQPGLSDSEREVLKVLWDRGPGTVREINAELRAAGGGPIRPSPRCSSGWPPSSMSPATRRRSRMCIVRRSRAMSFWSRLQDAADELCEGRAAPLVLALMQGGRFSPEELARLRRLLDEAAADSNAAPPKPRNKPKPHT